jgi:hypothetical protein
MIRTGPPVPLRIFMGSAMRVAPFRGQPVQRRYIFQTVDSRAPKMRWV